MKHKKWWILLSVASVLVMFCVVRAIWRPTSSHGADRTAVCERLAQANENVMEARFENAIRSMDPNKTEAADAETLKQLEAAKEAQLKQLEATEEAQPKQQEAAEEMQPSPDETLRQFSGNWGLPIEAVVGTGDDFYAVMGDKLVREGDVVNGFKVSKIRADRVELTKDGEVIIQKMD